MNFSEIKKTIEDRFQVTLIVVPYDKNEQPVCIEDDDEYILCNIYLLDENGGKIGTVNNHTTVGETLAQLKSEDRQEVKVILLLEAQKIACAPD